MMLCDYYLGIDPGLIHDPSGFVLVRVVRPAVVVQDGKVLDAITGKQMVVPKGTTIAEFVSPRFDVVDVQSRQGLTFSQIAREAKAVMEDMGGANFTAVCDSTGLGVGATDAIRRAGVPCVGVTLTAGSRITGRSRWSINLPVSLMFAGMFSIMSQNRLRVTSPAGEKLISELKEVEKRVSDQGRESFVVATGRGHHADTVFACAMALIIGERKIGRQSRTVALNPEGHQRKQGRPRQGNTAKQVIKQRLEQSRLQSEATMWAQIGQDKVPDFE